MPTKYFRREELVGKDVYSHKGGRVGKVSDVVYSLPGETALIIQSDGEEQIIPFYSIAEVSDIILLKSGKMVLGEERKIEKTFLQKTKICPNCSQKNKWTAKFCIKCRHEFHPAFYLNKENIMKEIVGRLQGVEVDENLDVKGRRFNHKIDLVITFPSDPRKLSIGSLGIKICNTLNEVFEYLGRTNDLDEGYFNPLILITTEEAVTMDQYIEFERYIEKTRFNLDLWTFFITRNNSLKDIGEVISACESLQEAAHHIE